MRRAALFNVVSGTFQCGERHFSMRRAALFNATSGTFQCGERHFSSFPVYFLPFPYSLLLTSALLSYSVAGQRTSIPSQKSNAKSTEVNFLLVFS